ncbi:MAG: SAM-dependent methyltransferase [Bacteroidetes bacterium]|nr:MAG: SAM-dependent methyltransferase [Bacteroidota bacterium]
MKIEFLCLGTLLGFLLPACQQGGQHGHHHGHANEHMNRASFEELVSNFESSERKEWQKPEEVIALFGELQGKTIMDIGSGTGYFSFPLARAGARVIAADVDERFLNYIKEKKAEKGMSDEQIETRKVPYDSPLLDSAEVDEVIIVNTYHHIENRPQYFAQVHRGLKPGGRLWVIDFKKEETPHGPPLEMRLSPEEVQTELQQAGFASFTLNDTLLPYQYILIAQK